ncbi:hypothetical protein ALP26_102503 [Pseudomonas savastanoi pv. glycinea]|uniref:Uncharacterized protein n=1 Tax=Pseudomonas savastanoi pv. glycinea TaxID=318 RepID=A0ABR5LHF9_PSESG|nr:Unknown protein sequence [Pseudomonas savastanoi pv. glycinea]KPC32703.1 Unknown protein sequence [Pseudomonas savastanoi pv. glycinea]KPC32710.1 Unknown protein sequence [Pseudomonas savastanoi pv. glycinea]KPC44970.1 Unknown protein sequence [Pseudomonas savastanoi pv. glycinea]KPC47539.1 Unknown protein sequence [Pseudomonas savastanoi pv. glycinea]
MYGLEVLHGTRRAHSDWKGAFYLTPHTIKPQIRQAKTLS